MNKQKGVLNISRCAFLCAVLVLTGCVANGSKQPDVAATKASDKEKLAEARVNKMRKWVGRNVQALVAEMGDPGNTIDTTLLGRPPSEAFIYQPKDGTDCTDAFVVVEGTGEIIDYFCR